MSNLPEPLTPIDCDLRDFPFMPLDVTRLRDSDLAALEEPEACWAAVLLWCASWHQLPAASLPDDDRVLSNLAGFGRVVKEWMKVRNGALRGWIKCSDGRLYHHAVAEKALTAWQGKLQQAWKTELARIKKHNQRHPQDLLKEISFEEYLSSRTKAVCPQDIKQNNERQEPPVPVVSEEKQHPKERERERDTDNNNLSECVEYLNTSEPNQEKTHTQIQIGLIAEGLTAIGMIPFNPQLPKFTALVDAGATVDEFVSTALEKKGTDKFNFSYLLTTMTNRRQEAAEAKPLHKGAMPQQQSKTQSIHDKRSATAKAMFGDNSNANNQSGSIIDVSDYSVEPDRPLISAHG
jgi:hypothetical protein